MRSARQYESLRHGRRYQSSSMGGGWRSKDSALSHELNLRTDGGGETEETDYNLISKYSYMYSACAGRYYSVVYPCLGIDIVNVDQKDISKLKKYRLLTSKGHAELDLRFQISKYFRFFVSGGYIFAKDGYTPAHMYFAGGGAVSVYLWYRN